MSLLGHLVRATLAPERAARPSLPQQFANWGGAGGTDDGEWGEEVSTPASRPMPRAAPISDDSFAERSSPSPTGPKPDKSTEMPRRAPRRQPAEIPEIEAVSPPRPVQPSRTVGPMVENAQAASTPNPMVEEAPATTVRSPRSALPQSEVYAGETAPPPRRGRQAEVVELPALERPYAAPPQPPRAADAVAAAIPVNAVQPRAIVPDVARAPIDIPSRPARHDLPSPVEARTSPSAPDLPRAPARLEEPRVVVPVDRDAARNPAARPATPLVVPVATPPAAAAPILATPQVTLPDSAPARPQLPDVHISIGRVEVRAAAAPPRPASRDASSKSETLSLDAYLSRRNGSGR